MGAIGASSMVDYSRFDAIEDEDEVDDARERHMRSMDAVARLLQRVDPDVSAARPCAHRMPRARASVQADRLRGVARRSPRRRRRC